MVLSMDRWKNKVAVVTGASSGCGASIVEALVDAGLQVVGLARRPELVSALAARLAHKPGKLHPLRADVTVESDVVEAFAWTKSHLGPVHVLVNNAGVSQLSDLVDGDASKWRRVFDTNVLGLCVCTREAVRQMGASGGEGHVVHVNSLLGHFVYNVPHLSVYAASKFAVTALAETLRQELIAVGSDVKVTSISPGPVDTEFASAAGVLESQESKKFFEGIPKLKASDVADAVIYALSTPPETLVSELMLRPMGALV